MSSIVIHSKSSYYPTGFRSKFIFFFDEKLIFQRLVAKKLTAPLLRIISDVLIAVENYQRHNYMNVKYVCIEHEVSQRDPKWHPWKHLQVWSISLFTIPLLDLRKEWYVLFFVFFHTDIYIMAFIVRGKQIKLHSTFPEFLWSWVPPTVVCKLYPVLWISKLF